MREDVCNKIKPDIKLSSNVIYLSGFGKNEVCLLGSFETDIEIDRKQFPCTIHVVPNKATNMSFIVGSDILATAELTINSDGITVYKTSPTKFLAEINVIEEQPLDIGCTDPNIREKVEEIVKTYQINKCKTTDVNMRIIPKDEKSIFQKPRRLPAPKRDVVKKQVAEWLNESIVEEYTSKYASPVVIVKKKMDHHACVSTIESLIEQLKKTTVTAN